MHVCLLRVKLHNARVTEANLYYEGSLTLDEALMEACGLYPGERVQVVNVNNGARLETYLIPGKAHSGIVCLNGPAARLVHVNDIVHILAYVWLTPEEAKGWQPVTYLLDANNRIVQKWVGFQHVPR